MNMIAVDDERLALENITALINEVTPEAEVRGFLTSSEALESLSKQPAEVAFLDIEMGRTNGIALAKKFKDLCPDINIIFVTGYDCYTMDAFKLHASGYLIKPVRERDLQAELHNLRYPLPFPATNRVRIQTFGNFEVFADKKPLHFTMTKCKECLAYLVDRRGACITGAELSTVLWEDKPYDRTMQNNIHRVTSDLMKTLKEAGVEEIVIKTRKNIGINTEKVDCDYYRFLKGDVSQINAFHGEYMSNYSWSEFTLAELVKSENKY